MRDRIKAAAEANNRSMNSEILALLEEKFPVRNLIGDAGKWVEHIHAADTDAEFDKRLAEANAWAAQAPDQNVIRFQKSALGDGWTVAIVVDRYRSVPIK